MKNVVITGCAGFVGSWICEKALKENYNVIGIDNLSSNVNYTPKDVDFYNLDVNSDITNILNKADAIVHASAYAELRHNWDNPLQREKLFYNNEMATRNVLENMPDVPIIFLSSASVYGSLSLKEKEIALTEDKAVPELCESPYAASKLACEAYVATWAFKKKIPWYSLRLVNQVGARSHRGVITDFAKMVNEKNHIHAADNGQQRKNWVSVEDTAEAIIYLLKSYQNTPSGIYNVTSDERWSWKDIVCIMKEVYIEKNPECKNIFTLTHEDKIAGSIGDPINLYVSGEKLKKYFNCERSVEKSVRDALNFINWGSK